MAIVGSRTRGTRGRLGDVRRRVGRRPDPPPLPLGLILLGSGLLAALRGRLLAACPLFRQGGTDSSGARHWRRCYFFFFSRCRRTVRHNRPPVARS